MLWCKDENKPAWYCGKELLYLLACMHRMIIKDYLNGIALRISFVKDFQEIDEIIAFMSITYKRDCFSSQKINGCQKEMVPRRLYS